MPDRTKSSTITFSSSVKMMLARTGGKQDPIETPSICLNKTLSKEKAVLVQESIKIFFECAFFVT